MSESPSRAKAETPPPPRSSTNRSFPSLFPDGNIMYFSMQVLLLVFPSLVAALLQAVSAVKLANTSLNLPPSSPDFTLLRRRAQLTFQRSKNPFTRKQVADYIDLDGARTFFKVNKTQFFLFQQEQPYAVNREELIEDYPAYNLQTGEIMTMRTRVKFGVEVS